MQYPFVIVAQIQQAFAYNAGPRLVLNSEGEFKS